MTEKRWWLLAVAFFCIAGAVLRMRGLDAPLLDHPGWRQGDTAAIARNFATLNYNIFFPQTEYNGPAPNYVELELQIVPFLAATLYKLFGIHEVFGRLIAIAFGVATIAVVGAFARWLFASTVAGIGALAVYAILPGAVYYSRTFQPDVAMVFFLVAALYAFARWVVDDDARTRGFAVVVWGLFAAAFLAKQVALVALLPAGALVVARFGMRGIAARPLIPLVLAGALIPLALYEPYVAGHAEWHWASGIMRLHILPQLRDGLTSIHGFAVKAVSFARALRMLGTTMLGPVGLALLVAGFALPLRSRADALLYGWLGGGLLYAYVVVTVERVDYYLYPLVPLGALAGGALIARAWSFATTAPNRRAVAAVALAIAWLGTAYLDRRLVRPYYAWSARVYADALALNRTLAPQTLIVMGHYDPSVMYYIGHKGWMEDPILWTTFDEQSAIRKGARYFVSVEDRRLRHNLELCAWLQRFPVLDPAARWPVYHTDPALAAPQAERDWQAFRRAELAGTGRAYLDAHAPRCALSLG
jgi:4-amino-4-deoxy-L-arabinose transferase-like glycosyltransferase